MLYVERRTSGDSIFTPLRFVAHSGSTLIACEQTGRQAFLMEIDALYCDVIVQRWQEFTGREAECVAAAEETAHANG